MAKGIKMNQIKTIRYKSTGTSKYGNKKVTIDGYKFDSRAEGKRYTQLKMLLKSGKIQDLVLQPEFLLQEKFTCRDIKYQAIKYVADFKYHTIVGGVVEAVVEDVKGKITDVYAIKKKMFLMRFGKSVIFKEIMLEDL